MYVFSSGGMFVTNLPFYVMFHFSLCEYLSIGSNTSGEERSGEKCQKNQDYICYRVLIS